MMQAYEIKSSKSDYPYLVIASQMTKAIDVFCRITEETEVVIESIKLLPYSCDRVFVSTMIENPNIREKLGKSKPIPKKPIKTNPFFGGEKK